MKLTAKLISIFFLGILVMSTIFAWIAIRWEEKEFYRQANANAEQMGAALRERIVLAWNQRGEEEVVRVIRQISDVDQRWQLKWIGLHSSPGGRDHRQEHFSYSYEIILDKGRSGRLEISQTLEELKQNKQRAIEDILWFSAAQVSVLGLLIALFGIRFIGRPLRQLIEKTRKISRGDLSSPLPSSGKDELGELAESLNTMCDQLSASQNQVLKEASARVDALEQLRHADRLRTVGRLASGLAHELGTPLNVVAGRASLIYSEKLSTEEIAQSAKTIRKEVDRMTGILRQLLDFARRSPPQTMPGDLRQIVLNTLDLLRSLAEKNDVQLNFIAAETPFPIQVDAEQFRQVVSNLVMNAIQSMPQGGVITLELTERAELPQTISHQDSPETPPPYYCLTIKDQGVGIAKEDMEHLFEPFFTTKGVGEGTGLGLSISYGIIKEHGGWIDVQSDLGEGSCFSIYIPVEASRCREKY